MLTNRLYVIDISTVAELGQPARRSSTPAPGAVSLRVCVTGFEARAHLRRRAPHDLIRHRDGARQRGSKAVFEEHNKQRSAGGIGASVRCLHPPASVSP